MEYLTVKLIKSEFEANRSKFSDVEYKEVSFKDSFFDGDEQHSKLKANSLKAYKQFKEYEFDKRTNNPIK